VNLSVNNNILQITALAVTIAMLAILIFEIATVEPEPVHTCPSCGFEFAMDQKELGK